MKKPLVTEIFADNGEHSHWKLIGTETGRTLWEEKEQEHCSEKSDQKEITSSIVCKGCDADLTLRNAISRKYTSKDDGKDRYGIGHYDKMGDYEPDYNTYLADGRYDLHDGSDTCSICKEIVG